MLAQPAGPAAPEPRKPRPMFGKIAQFIRDVRSEMGKVTWPTRDELSASTTIVLVVSLALAVFIFIADFILSRIMDLILV
jgi:preprotein translocase subunit SecE